LKGVALKEKNIGGGCTESRFERTNLVSESSAKNGTRLTCFDEIATELRGRDCKRR